MKTTQLLAIGVGLAAGISAPLLSQRSNEAALEAACRATEVSAPQSCTCTIAAARDAGITDAQMASLFQDDGHSNPVPGQTYTRFWQVKSKCMSEAMLAQMGVTPGNPLPGVPTNMLPGNIPGAIPNVPQMTPPPSTVTRQPPTQVARQAPVPQASSPRRDLQPTTRRDLASAAPQSSPARTPSAPSATDRSGNPCNSYGGPGYVKECGDTGTIWTVFEYDPRIAQYPGLMREVGDDAVNVMMGYSRGQSERAPYPFGLVWSISSINGRLISLSAAHGEQSRGRYGAVYDMLWDTKLDRSVQWQDVFGADVWRGYVQSEYCQALRQRFAEMAQGGERLDKCPSLGRLSKVLRNTESGSRVLSFSASPGVIASYASSAIYDGVELPLTGELLAAVKPPYREALGASGARRMPNDGSSAFIARLGDVQLGPPHLQQTPDCVTEMYLQPGDIGQPTGIEAIREIIKRSPKLVMVISAGMLGQDGWVTGLVLDGRFLKLDTRSAPGQQSYASPNGDLTVFYQPTNSFSEVSYGGWGYGELIVTLSGETYRVPVLQQSWQCT
ncbi:MAG: hypothetical protein AAFR88_00595 [Pseudomonadota bacterium]